MSEFTEKSHFSMQDKILITYSQERVYNIAVNTFEMFYGCLSPSVVLSASPSCRHLEGRNHAL